MRSKEVISCNLGTTFLPGPVHSKQFYSVIIYKWNQQKIDKLTNLSLIQWHYNQYLLYLVHLNVTNYFQLPSNASRAGACQRRPSAASRRTSITNYRQRGIISIPQLVMLELAMPQGASRIAGVPSPTPNSSHGSGLLIIAGAKLPGGQESTTLTRRLVS